MLFSPEFPSSSGNLIECQYKVTAPVGKVVKLSVPHIYLRDGFDTLEIFSGGSASGEPFAK